jgi:hypothetical protein
MRGDYPFTPNVSQDEGHTEYSVHGATDKSFVAGAYTDKRESLAPFKEVGMETLWRCVITLLRVVLDAGTDPPPSDWPPK